MQLRMIAGLIASIVFTSSTFGDSVLLQDQFTSFNTATTWQALPGPTVSGSSPGYIGLPQSITPGTIAGRSVVTFDSTFSGNSQNSGFRSQAAFNGLSSAKLEVDFYASGGIDALLEAGLVGDSGGEGLGIFGGNFGANRTVDDSQGNISSGPNDWQYNTFYRFVLTAGQHSTALSFEDDNGNVLISTNVASGLADFGSNLHVELLQGDGTPFQTVHAIAAVDSVTFSGDVAAPLPTTAWAVLALLPLALLLSKCLRRSISQAP